MLDSARRVAFEGLDGLDFFARKLIGVDSVLELEQWATLQGVFLKVKYENK